MEKKTDRELLQEVHNDVKRIIPLVERHERDMNRGKGVLAVVILYLGWLFNSNK